jgi:hypothetical protein
MAADRTDEGDAATVLRHVLGETVTVIDVPGAPDGTCDILAVPANRRIAVEVTSIVDAGELGFSHAVTAANWEPPGLADPWGVSLCPRDDREETPEVPTRSSPILKAAG